MRHVRLIPLTAVLSAAVLLAGCSSSEASFPVRTHPMGDRVELGHIIYTVFETQWMTHIGEGPLARVPQNRFFLVRMTAVNSGSGDQILSLHVSRNRSLPSTMLVRTMASCVSTQPLGWDVVPEV